MKPTIVILAAGMGSRYGGLKQLDGVGPNGESILEYSVYDAIRAGFGKLVFVIRPDFAKAFKAMVDQTFGAKTQVAYVYQDLTMLPDGFEVPEQRQKPWGTGHATLCAEPLVNEPFSVINADDFYGATAFKLLADYLMTAQDTDLVNYAMVGYILRNTLSEHGSVSRGVCQYEDDYLQRVVELTKIEKDGDHARYTDESGQVHPLSGDEIVSLNMWGFTPAFFRFLREQFIRFLQKHGQKATAEFYLPAAVDELIMRKKARVRILPSQESWFGVTYREDTVQVAKSIRTLIDQGVYPEKLWD